MLRIGILGAHGTGKSTLAQHLNQHLKLPSLERTLRSMYEQYGIEDFDKLPGEVRTYFQKTALLAQISREQAAQNFISDRTVLDIYAYTRLAADFPAIDFETHKELIKTHAHSSYTHLIYTPIEFLAPDEILRAKMELQHLTDQYMQEAIELFAPPEIPLIKVTGTVEQRVKQCLEVIVSS